MWSLKRDLKSFYCSHQKRFKNFCKLFLCGTLLLFGIAPKSNAKKSRTNDEAPPICPATAQQPVITRFILLLTSLEDLKLFIFLLLLLKISHSFIARNCRRCIPLSFSLDYSCIQLMRNKALNLSLVLIKKERESKIQNFLNSF